MALNKYAAVASGVLTATIWDNQMNDVGSYFNYQEDVRVGSSVYTYTGSGIASGIGVFTAGSETWVWKYNTDGTIASGISEINGVTTTRVYSYGGGSVVTQIDYS